MRMEIVVIILPALTLPSGSLTLRGNRDCRQCDPEQADQLERVLLIFLPRKLEASPKRLLISTADKDDQRLNNQVHMIQLMFFERRQAWWDRQILSRPAYALQVGDHARESVGWYTGYLLGNPIELTH